jgi:inositol phosphorylceramide synthase catalytic subunit
MTYRNINLYSWKRILSAAAATVIYLTVSYFLIGFKTDQLVLAGIFNVFYFASAVTRKFILGFCIFIVYWIIFDYMKAFPNYRFGQVHIGDLYNAEKSLFGIADNGKLITPNEYWILHQNKFLDILTGVFYLCWIPVPLVYAAYLFFKNKHLFLYFSLTFVLVNFIGFIGYYTYPAAPPWYIQQYGLNFIAHTSGHTAGLARFDHILGVSIFQNLYAKSSNVFAAMPSLHSSYPLVVLYFGIKKKAGWLMNLLFMTVMIGIWFAAVYNSHHYLLDVIAGILCAVIGIVLFEKILMRSASFNQFLQYYHQKISH